jgi:hypothetical protein
MKRILLLLALLPGCALFLWEQPEYRMAVRGPFGAIPDSTFVLQAKYHDWGAWKELGTYSSREDCEAQARACMALHPSSESLKPPEAPKPKYIPLYYHPRKNRE